MKIKVFFLLLLALSACKTEEKEVRLVTPNGLEYLMHRSDAEEKARIGDILVIDMTYGTEDSVIFDSKKFGKPIYLQVTNPAYKGSIEEGLQLLGTGDSATFFLTADSVYQRIFNQALPKGIKPGSELIFQIGVLAIRNEDRDLERYLINQQINTPARGSGLIMIKSKENPKGLVAAPGKTVKVHYTGKLLDGTIFDSSHDRNEAFSFVLGQGMVIAGWDEGVSLMRQGEQATLIIPSYLAYGPKGAGGGTIPPYSTLIFDVELLEVEK